MYINSTRLSRRSLQDISNRRRVRWQQSVLLNPGRRWASQSSSSAGGGQDYQMQPGQASPVPNTQQWGSQDGPEEPGDNPKKPGSKWGPTLFKMFETAATTFASLSILGLAGYGYHKYYKHLVLKKMSNAFKPGDPVLELAALGKGHPKTDASTEHSEHWIPRKEQDQLDAIINGSNQGRYHLLIGEKGTGKSSMIIDAMHKIDGEGVAMFEAHADLEIFRVRLGKALDFEFHEDYIGSLFSIKGPRDTTALLDIERAFNKLEKVALKRRSKVGKPLILIINSMHLLRDDEDGRDLLELVQQRAEQWAASNLVTTVLNSDDYWIYEALKKYATRMEVIPVLDLPKMKAISALKKYRAKYFHEVPPPTILEQVYDLVGGRLTYLSRVAKSEDMLRTCEKISEVEKTWFLNQCWILGEEMDDDVMDQQKYASAAMVLAKALVDQEAEMDQIYDPERGHILPQIPLHKARQVMTRADFIQKYDHVNLFTIDSKANVRADSVPMQNAFRAICREEGFEEHLNATLDRIAAIESLGRTREVVAKDLENLGQYTIEVGPGGGRFGDGKKTISIVKKIPKDDDEGGGGDA
ncbi:MAG: hypothetical protein M4579_001976 [Chaenotheca gracillima]|nr:MAG: hypothetical protein M4579_001976 [Chaenotheca gracillima]